MRAALLAGALVAASCAQQPEKPKLPDLPEIIVPEPAISGQGPEDWIRIPKGMQFPDTPRVDSVVKKTFAGWLAPDEIVRIRVDRLHRRETPWTPESVKRALVRMLSVNLEGPPSSHFIWAEMTDWSIEAVVLLKSGKEGKLWTDGLHIAYLAPDGSGWFNRALPPSDR